MTHYFSNASRTKITNLTISHITENTVSIGRSEESERKGLRLLLDNISKGAFHDAAERGDPPKCHPDTRIALREEIMEWIQAPDTTRTALILWMYGPAGSGKTAIAQSIAEECVRRGLLAASFFFGRAAPGLSDATCVVATIAYQISRFLPQIEGFLFAAIENDPTIFSRTLATQMRTLIIEPLNSVLGALTAPIFVVLDGLDEIGPDVQSQAILLDVIGMAISELQHIPLIFLIASRPEYELREAFDGALINSLMRPLELDNRYNPDADIQLYFNTVFRQIHDKHRRLGTHLPSPWPSAGDVDHLVSKASGQFIFASTVMKFVDAARRNPALQLDIIMGLSATGNETPFALLDALYRHILSSVASLSHVLEILTLLLLSPAADSPKLTVELIGALLGIEVRRALVDIHALVFVPLPTDDSSIVRIHHASLYDFLVDRSRSQEYYIDKTQGHVALSRRWLKAIGNDHITTEISLSTRVDSFIFHSRHSPANSEIADDLVHYNLNAALETMFVKSADILEIHWSNFFDSVKRQVTIPRRKFLINIKQRFGARSRVLARLRREFFPFIIDCISKYPQPLQNSIPTILALENPRHFFDMLTRAEGLLLGDVYDSGCSDSNLLNLTGTPWCDGIFRQLFKDPSLAGLHHVHSGSYLTLAKQIVAVKFPALPGGGQRVLLRKTRSGRRRLYDDCVDMLRHDADSFSKSFSILLSKASTDSELAQLLFSRALQYYRPFPGDRNNREKSEADRLALGSLFYVQRCGLPYSEHTHPQGTNECIICFYFFW